MLLIYSTFMLFYSFKYIFLFSSFKIYFLIIPFIIKQNQFKLKLLITKKRPNLLDHIPFFIILEFLIWKLFNAYSLKFLDYVLFYFSQLLFVSLLGPLDFNFS